jgi:hypothetical protein
VFVYVCVYVQVERPCDELITRPRSATDCLRFRKKPKWNGEFHGGRPRPKLGLGIGWNLLLYISSLFDQIYMGIRPNICAVMALYSETSTNRQFLLTVSPYSMYSKQIVAKNHPRFTASGGGAGVAHYCSIDESRSWPAYLSHTWSVSVVAEKLLCAVLYVICCMVTFTPVSFVVKVSFLFLCNSKKNGWKA